MLFARVCIVLVQVGLGTVFGPAAGDRWNPDDRLACTPGRRIGADDVVVAHPSLPCGTDVLVCVIRTGRCVRAVVADRGPRHAMVDLGMGTARRLGWRRRGGFTGYEPVVIISIERACATLIEW